MSIVGRCQDRALLLLQIAEENPQVREVAAYLAGEWLMIATLQTNLVRMKQAEKAPMLGT
jgi:hypothetical protein